MAEDLREKDLFSSLSSLYSQPRTSIPATTATSTTRAATGSLVAADAQKSETLSPTPYATPSLAASRGPRPSAASDSAPSAKSADASMNPRATEFSPVAAAFQDRCAR